MSQRDSNLYFEKYMYSPGQDFWDILTQHGVSWRRFIIDMVHYILRHDP